MCVRNNNTCVRNNRLMLFHGYNWCFNKLCSQTNSQLSGKCNYGWMSNDDNDDNFIWCLRSVKNMTFVRFWIYTTFYSIYIASRPALWNQLNQPLSQLHTSPLHLHILASVICCIKFSWHIVNVNWSYQHSQLLNRLLQHNIWSPSSRWMHTAEFDVGKET